MGKHSKGHGDDCLNGAFCSAILGMGTDSKEGDLLVGFFERLGNCAQREDAVVSVVALSGPCVPPSTDYI